MADIPVAEWAKCNYSSDRLFSDSPEGTVVLWSSQATKNKTKKKKRKVKHHETKKFLIQGSIYYNFYDS